MELKSQLRWQETTPEQLVNAQELLPENRPAEEEREHYGE